MMGRQSAQEDLFYEFRLEDHVPDDHMLRRLDAVLNFDRVRSALADRYSPTGRPSVDPELMLRMLLIGSPIGALAMQRGTSESCLSLVLPRDFKDLCKRVKITGVRCSPHTLRHTFAVGYPCRRETVLSVPDSLSQKHQDH